MKTTHKSLITGLISTMVLIHLIGCAATKPDFDKMISEGSEVRIYEVFGMDCPGCHGGLENLVNEIPGVITSQANWEKQQLKVVLRPKAEVNDNTVYDAIKRANFTPGNRLN